jgi:hypothetical protein
MDQGHWIRKRRGTWIIAVPPEVRDLLGVTHRARLYWTVRRSGEAILSMKAKPQEGRTPVRQLARDLAAARLEIKAIAQRDAMRDRGMYAEGYSHGYIQAYERLVSPDGPSAERGHRRARYRWAFPTAAQVSDPKQLGPRPAPDRPRQNSRTRRAQREAREELASRAVETIPAPLLSSPSESSGELTRRGGEPQVSHSEPTEQGP